MTECDLLRRAEAALLDFFGGEKCVADHVTPASYTDAFVFASMHPEAGAIPERA
jgi:hypothetical protein